MYIHPLLTTLLLPIAIINASDDYACCTTDPLGTATGHVSSYTTSCCAVKANIKHSSLGDSVSFPPLFVCESFGELFRWLSWVLSGLFLSFLDWRFGASFAYR